MGKYEENPSPKKTNTALKSLREETLAPSLFYRDR